jgi:hypothetical protein
MRAHGVSKSLTHSADPCKLGAGASMSAATQICRGFTDEQWKGLRLRLGNGDEEAWRCAVEVFERRTRERFLSCIEALVDADSGLDVDTETLRGAAPDCSTLSDDGGRRVVVPGVALRSWRSAARLSRRSNVGEQGTSYFGVFGTMGLGVDGHCCCAKEPDAQQPVYGTRRWVGRPRGKRLMRRRGEYRNAHLRTSMIPAGCVGSTCAGIPTSSSG